jgi:dsRNA-specific ribonuclease
MIATRTSPVAFYSFLYAISNHYDYVHHIHDAASSTALMRLSYKAETIKLVNQMMNNLNKEVPDVLLAAVLVLASQGPRVDSGEVSRFRSPLATAQCLDHQGNLAFELEHTRGMLALVQLKGGLHNIEMRGLADVIVL